MSSPKPCEFRRSVELDAPVEKVFAFHGDPHNIGKISPRWQIVEVREGQAVPRPDERFEIRVRVLGLFTLVWRGVWREVNAPEKLVDEALKSPFVYWRHRHIFEVLDDGHTRMTDHVSYAFPGGWLGKWFGETLGRLQFKLMFADRHRRTARWFARPSQS